MALWLGIPVGVACAFVLAMFLLVRKISFQGNNLPVTAEWIDELSADRYRPMLRLLDESDIVFLRSQPGFNPRMEGRVRAQRCNIFRGYLKSLDVDFTRTCSALKLVILRSQFDRPDLASTLIRAQLNFAYAKVMVQLHMVLYYFGLGSVDVRGLVSLFDGMRLELRTLVPATEGAMA